MKICWLERGKRMGMLGRGANRCKPFPDIGPAIREIAEAEFEAKLMEPDFYGLVAFVWDDSFDTAVFLPWSEAVHYSANVVKWSPFGGLVEFNLELTGGKRSGNLKVNYYQGQDIITLRSDGSVIKNPEFGDLHSFRYFMYEEARKGRGR